MGHRNRPRGPCSTGRTRCETHAPASCWGDAPTWGALRWPSHSPTALPIGDLLFFFLDPPPPHSMDRARAGRAPGWVYIPPVAARIGGLVPWVRLFPHAKPMAATKLSIKYPSQEARPSRGGQWPNGQGCKMRALAGWCHGGIFSSQKAYCGPINKHRRAGVMAAFTPPPRSLWPSKNNH